MRIGRMARLTLAALVAKYNFRLASARKRFQECETSDNCEYGSACVKAEETTRCKCLRLFKCHLYTSDQTESHGDSTFSCVLYDNNYYSAVKYES